MDPDEALRKMREAIATLRAAMPSDANEHSDADAELETLIDSAEALDDWMTQGGFPPRAWRK